ncbi:MAG: tol-pal system YbgF family protein [Acidiferrobacterales bacterium]
MTNVRYNVLILCLILTGCVSAPTEDAIKNIEDRNFEVQQQAPSQGGRNKAIQSYRDFLKKEESDPLRAEAMRRLADLEMERTEAAYLDKAKQLEQGGKGEAKLKPADYQKAIKTYVELLRTHPNYPGNDQVFYQLARAYEQNGDYRHALRTLDRLVERYPDVKFIDEVQFRRGELLFVKESYRASERAYSAVIKFGDTSLFYERALYKHGWSLFKQSRYEPALDSFSTLLDRKLARVESRDTQKEVRSLGRGDQELVNDTYRVTTLSFSYLGGEKTITRYFKKKGARPYEADVYDNLGKLYIKQERYQDAANVFDEFIREHASEQRAPLFQVKIIDAYKQGRFPTLLLSAKEKLITAYGVGSKFWTAQDRATQAMIAPHLKRNIEDLARHFHAQAQRSRKAADYHFAARWYGEFVQAFPDDRHAPKMNFLLAETLFDGKRYGEAAIQYEKTAYTYAPHADGAEAGYAALLAHKKREQELRGRKRAEYRRRSLASAVRFADAFPRDKRAPAVVTKAAEDLFALNELKQATEAARRVVIMKPLPAMGLRRTAWTVIAHAQFEQSAYAEAEHAYQAVLHLTPNDDVKRTELIERLASSVYKQGEQERVAGNLQVAVSHFLRVRKIAPTSSITPTAEYDAAAGLIALKDWRRAVSVLESFRKSFPNHPLQGDVPEKLAAAYLEGKQWGRAAAVFEHIAAQRSDRKVKREALWQAAELYEKGAHRKSAVAVYKRYIRVFPDAFEQGIEARHRLAQLYLTSRQGTTYYYWLRQIVDAADTDRKQHTERTRYLAAKAAFSLGERAYREFAELRLVIPLASSLKAKKKKMQVALKAYGRATDYGVAEYTTAATFRIAEIYHSLSRDLIASERPKGLSTQELEQYDVLLEEQAYPFEEKAIEIHELNAKRVADDVYDEWVRKSFEQLRKLRPVQYAKFEKSERLSNAIQ